MSCPGCNKILITENGGMVIEALGSKFHADCFKCSKCRSVIKGNFGEYNGSVVCKSCMTLTCSGCQGAISAGGYVELGGRPYHERCVPDGGVGSSNSCATCGRELDGDCVSTGGLSYHAACFVCSSCKQALKAQYFTYEGQVYCKLCRVTARMDKEGDKMSAREQNRENQKVLGSKIRRADGTEAKPAGATQGSPAGATQGSPATATTAARNNASSPTIASSATTNNQASRPAATVAASAISAAPTPATAAAPSSSSGGGNPAFCPECGTKSVPNRPFCGECGHKFGAQAVAKVELPSNYEDLQRRFAALKSEDD